MRNVKIKDNNKSFVIFWGDYFNSCLGDSIIVCWSIRTFFSLVDRTSLDLTKNNKSCEGQENNSCKRVAHEKKRRMKNKKKKKKEKNRNRNRNQKVFSSSGTVPFGPTTTQNAQNGLQLLLGKSTG